jgi:hypothetical protein
MELEVRREREMEIIFRTKIAKQLSTHALALDAAKHYTLAAYKGKFKESMLLKSVKYNRSFDCSKS